MEHSTPHLPQPKTATLDFLHRLARFYRPESGISREMAQLMAQSQFPPQNFC